MINMKKSFRNYITGEGGKRHEHILKSRWRVAFMACQLLLGYTLYQNQYKSYVTHTERYIYIYIYI